MNFQIKKSLFHNLNIKVTFAGNKNLYTIVQPRTSHIKDKFLSADIVYQYDCSVCDIHYVGYTEPPPNVRSAEHSCMNPTLSRAHFSFANCSGAIMIARERNRFDLKTKEGFFIYQLEPQLNVGYESIKRKVTRNNFLFIVIDCVTKIAEINVVVKKI